MTGRPDFTTPDRQCASTVLRRFRDDHSAYVSLQRAHLCARSSRFGDTRRRRRRRHPSRDLDDQCGALRYNDTRPCPGHQSFRQRRSMVSAPRPSRPTSSVPRTTFRTPFPTDKTSSSASTPIHSLVRNGTLTRARAVSLLDLMNEIRHPLVRHRNRPELQQARGLRCAFRRLPRTHPIPDYYAPGRYTLAATRLGLCDPRTAGAARTRNIARSEHGRYLGREDVKDGARSNVHAMHRAPAGPGDVYVGLSSVRTNRLFCTPTL